jgi:predicted Zn-dependent protease
VEYVDIRVIRRQDEEIDVKNAKAEALTHDEDFASGIRILSQGVCPFL